MPDPSAICCSTASPPTSIARTFANGIQGDGSYRLNDAHTLRAGFLVSGEKTQVTNLSTLPTARCSRRLPTASTRRSPSTDVSLASSAGSRLYVQDEWKITDQLTLNAGLRFDQMYQFVNANQLSPRVNLVYKPLRGTTFHAGYARYFTPPPQVDRGAGQSRRCSTTGTGLRTPGVPRTVWRSGAAGTLACFDAG